MSIVLVSVLTLELIFVSEVSLANLTSSVFAKLLDTSSTVSILALTLLVMVNKQTPTKIKLLNYLNTFFIKTPLYYNNYNI